MSYRTKSTEWRSHSTAVEPRRAGTNPRSAVLDRHLRTLAELPSNFHREYLVREYLTRALTAMDVTSYVDGIGNLYGVRRGHRPGHVMLTAHMDKQMGANRVLVAGVAEDVEDKRSALWLDDEHDVRLFGMQDGGFVGLQAHAGSSGTVLISAEGVLVEPENGFYALPRLTEQNGTVFGKLDDAVGLALIVDLFGDTDPESSPTLSALFTVGEEEGLHGARFAVEQGTLDELGPEVVVVLDVAPRTQTSSSPSLHLGYEREPSDSRLNERFAERITDSARRLGIAVETRWTNPTGAANDAYVLSCHTRFPTVGLDVPVDGLHEFSERMTWQDFDAMGRLLRDFLGRGMAP